jgi:hypothetical protein
MSSIERETELIDVLKSINNGSREIKRQLEYAERRLRKLEQSQMDRREKKSFVRRIEQEVGQEKLRNYLTQHGLVHMCHTFQYMTLREFQVSDPLDWPSISEQDLRYLLFLR